jgi:hypothetical protein
VTWAPVPPKKDVAVSFLVFPGAAPFPLKPMAPPLANAAKPPLVGCVVVGSGAAAKPICTFWGLSPDD